MDSLQYDYEVFKIISKLIHYFESQKYKSVKMLQVPKDYYDRPLNIRKQLLNCHDEKYLCKSMIMENTAFKSEHQSTFYPRFYCIILQYTTKLNGTKLLNWARKYQNDNCPNDKVGKNGYNLRLAQEEDSDKLSGYTHNAVTPFQMNEKLTIVISDKIEKLSPQFFWLGGGHVDAKIRISFQEFIQKSEYNVLVGDISD